MHPKIHFGSKSSYILPSKFTMMSSVIKELNIKIKRLFLKNDL